jgi:P-type Mg2+ transporter
MSWLLGVAVLAGVVIIATHFSEEQAFVRLTREAKPSWLLAALVLQAATYLAQGEIWRIVGRIAGNPLPLPLVYKLALAKLFIDQALPSGGVSGTVVVAQALEQNALPRPAVLAGVVVNTTSFFIAYVAALAAALVLLFLAGHASSVIVLPSILFIFLSAALSAGMLVFTAKNIARGPQWLLRHRIVRNALNVMRDADPRVVRNIRLQTVASCSQLLTFILDAATLWMLIRSLAATASLSHVFASFMIANVVRTISFIPGGLGTFEAAAVLMLRISGLSVAPALSATLLFRGLTFFLPMLPGLWFSRRIAKRPAAVSKQPVLDAYWSLQIGEVLDHLHSTPNGLSSAEAAFRLQHYGPNTFREHRRLSRLRVLSNQLRSPLLLLLVFAAGASALSGEWIDASIVLLIVAATVGFGYSREYSAAAAAAALRARVQTHTTVFRDGVARPVPLEEIVSGDVVLLSAGSLVPADAVVIGAADCFVTEAVLTGESFPTEKRPGPVDPAASLADRINCVFLGTNVRSGTAQCLVVGTGASTQFGAIAHRLTLRPPETEFDRGLRRFGYFLTTAMLIMVLLVFVAHTFRGRPAVETLLFSIALAVGLSPELLPAILSVNLARGAKMMAGRGVLVRRLNAIENLGSMDTLCTDKTGTLTEGVIQVQGAYDAAGADSPYVLELASYNAALQSGLVNPLDGAILDSRKPDLTKVEKLGEIPFDFVRKRLSVFVRTPDGVQLIVKGAFHHVIEVCTRFPDGTELDAHKSAQLERRYSDWSRQGTRVIAVAVRAMNQKTSCDRNDEHDMTFVGFVTFLDRPKAGVSKTITDLARLGVSVKLITGDNKLVAQHIAGLVGMHADRVLTGTELDKIHDEALWSAAERTDLFVEVDPNQKERIILSLKKMGHVVGFLGDGVNDAPAMHAADTSLSVETAVDVAREAADFVLLERNLDVIRGGIEEGRKTFANTLKYVLTTTSANLGNMVSMAAASLFLPFLPLTAGQILLNNFLSDIPAVGIANDGVDPELVDHPRRWDIRFIGRFMIEFGVLSSAFDFLTFATLLMLFYATTETFRTAWFIESLLTELVIALVVRTRRRFYQSRPGAVLLWSTISLSLITYAIPFLPFIGFLGFVPLPPAILVTLSAITAMYVVATEIGKDWFYRRTR